MKVIALIAFCGIISTAYGYGVCWGFGNLGASYASGNDCSKYYQCSFGQLVSRRCDDGLLYSSTYGSCVLPQHSGCSNYQSYVDARNKEYCSLLGEGALFPNVLRCNQFYECANGVPVKFDCPAGLVFNDLSKRCDYPNRASCVQFLQLPYHVEYVNGDDVVQEDDSSSSEEEVAPSNQYGNDDTFQEDDSSSSEEVAPSNQYVNDGVIEDDDSSSEEAVPYNQYEQGQVDQSVDDSYQYGMDYTAYVNGNDNANVEEQPSAANQYGMYGQDYMANESESD